MASQKYNILYGRLSQEDERQGESNSIHTKSCFWRSTRRTMDSRIPCSCPMTDTPVPTSSGPRGRKSWR